MNEPSLVHSGPLLRHPATWLAVLVWALNDHVGKGVGPGWITGKLSDVAAMIALPWLLLGALEWVCPRVVSARPRELGLVALALSGLMLLGLSTSSVVDEAFRYSLAAAQYPVRLALHALSGSNASFGPARGTVDVSDLWCLPALAIPFSLGMRTLARS